MRESRVQAMGWKDPLEWGMATSSSILGWRIPMDRGAWWAAVHGVTKSQTRLTTKHSTTQRKHENPTKRQMIYVKHSNMRFFKKTTIQTNTYDFLNP